MVGATVAMWLVYKQQVIARVVFLYFVDGLWCATFWHEMLSNGCCIVGVCQGTEY